MVEYLQPHFSVIRPIDNIRILILSMIRPCGCYQMFRISKYNILNDKNFKVKNFKRNCFY